MSTKHNITNRRTGNTAEYIGPTSSGLIIVRIYHNNTKHRELWSKSDIMEQVLPCKYKECTNSFVTSEFGDYCSNQCKNQHKLYAKMYN